jgi:hypothetical protein
MMASSNADPGAQHDVALQGLVAPARLQALEVRDQDLDAQAQLVVLVHQLGELLRQAGRPADPQQGGEEEALLVVEVGQHHAPVEPDELHHPFGAQLALAQVLRGGHLHGLLRDPAVLFVEGVQRIGQGAVEHGELRGGNAPSSPAFPEVAALRRPGVGVLTGILHGAWRRGSAVRLRCGRWGRLPLAAGAGAAE